MKRIIGVESWNAVCTPKEVSTPWIFRASTRIWPPVRVGWVMGLTFVMRGEGRARRPPSLRHSKSRRRGRLLKWRHQISDLAAPAFPRHGPGRGTIRLEASQTAAGQRVMPGGRKVRTPQSGVTVNGRPLKAASASPRYKARNRATETSVLSYGETR